MIAQLHCTCQDEKYVDTTSDVPTNRCTQPYLKPPVEANLSSSTPKTFHEVVATLIEGSPLTQREIAKKFAIVQRSSIAPSMAQNPGDVPVQ